MIVTTLILHLTLKTPSVQVFILMGRILSHGLIAFHWQFNGHMLIISARLTSI